MEWLQLFGYKSFANIRIKLATMRRKDDKAKFYCSKTLLSPLIFVLRILGRRN